MTIALTYRKKILECDDLPEMCLLHTLHKRVDLMKSVKMLSMKMTETQICAPMQYI